MASGCTICQQYLSERVYFYSMQAFGAPLCRTHQYYIRKSKATKEAIKLYIELRKRGIPAQIEKFDGYKTIDIAIPSFKLNIEVDGMHHYYDAEQALIDLQRMNYSYEKGYRTLRIPNPLIRYRIQDAVNQIIKFLTASQSTWRRKS